jgi:hypothetical protein
VELEERRRKVCEEIGGFEGKAREKRKSGRVGVLVKGLHLANYSN